MTDESATDLDKLSQAGEEEQERREATPEKPAVKVRKELLELSEN